MIPQIDILEMLLYSIYFYEVGMTGSFYLHNNFKRNQGRIFLCDPVKVTAFKFKLHMRLVVRIVYKCNSIRQANSTI